MKKYIIKIKILFEIIFAVIIMICSSFKDGYNYEEN